MKIIPTHKNQNTAPSCLSHQKHPLPSVIIKYISIKFIIKSKFIYKKLIFDHKRKEMNLIILSGILIIKK